MRKDLLEIISLSCVAMAFFLGFVLLLQFAFTVHLGIIPLLMGTWQLIGAFSVFLSLAIASKNLADEIPPTQSKLTKFTKG